MDQSLIILNIGYALTFIALAIREVLWLRTTLTAAQISLFTYHYFYADNLSAAFWTAIFVGKYLQYYKDIIRETTKNDSRRNTGPI